MAIIQKHIRVLMRPSINLTKKSSLQVCGNELCSLLDDIIFNIPDSKTDGNMEVVSKSSYLLIPHPSS